MARFRSTGFLVVLCALLLLGAAPPDRNDSADSEEQPAREPPIKVVKGPVTYGSETKTPGAEGGPSPLYGGSGPTCTVWMDDLYVSGGWELRSHFEQLCTAYVSQRFSHQNFQRDRWWGWQTIEWNEPATAWVSSTYIHNYEYDGCWSGTWTYRAIGKAQFFVAPTTYTSLWIVSDNRTLTC